MFVDLPTVTKTFDEKTRKTHVKRGKLRVNIDTSLYAHLRWDEQFAETAHCDFTTYIERIRNTGKTAAKANMLSVMKALYCFCSSDAIPTFADFVKLFDFDVAEEIVQIFLDIMTEAGKTATKN